MSFASGISQPFVLLRCVFAREFFGPSFSTLQSTFATKRDGRLILICILGSTRRAVFDLPGENISDQLTELNRITRTAQALFCHANIMHERV